MVAHGIPTAFPDEVLAEADQVPETIAESDLVGRRDLRDQLIVTIDGEDAKDLDDAVTVQKLANGNFFLGVHIADVSYYVTEGSQLDMEAYERGTKCLFDRPSCANDSAAIIEWDLFAKPTCSTFNHEL